MIAAGLASLCLAAAPTPTPTPAAPGAPARDFLYLSGEADDFSPGGGGGSGGILWTHAFPGGFSSEAGGYAYSLAGTSWKYVKLGASYVASPKAILHAEASLGGGRQQGAAIDYHVFRGSLSYALVAGRLWADLESQYIRFGESNGHVLKLGAVVAPRPALTGRLAGYVSTGGNLGARYLTFRLDLERRKFGLFAGLSVGRSRPELFHFFTSPVAVDSTEVYGGLRVPAGSHEITAYVDSVGSEGVRRNAVALVLKLRL